MDVVLELFDTFGFDYLWATVLPASATWTSFHPASAAANTTFSSSRELPSAYEYRPAASYYRLSPSRWAYQSALPRDNFFRQWISLYLITWSGPPRHGRRAPTDAT